MFGAFGIYVWFVGMAFLVSGVEMLLGLVPFKTSLLFALMFVSPLSFFCCFVCSPTTFFFFFLSLSLSLSGAGETQTPFGVWGSPGVLFLLDAYYEFDPYSLLLSSTKVSAPPCFFFVFSSALAWVFCLVLLLLPFLSVCLCVREG